MINHKETSWNAVGGWYHELLKQEGTYQKDVILPNMFRLLEIKKGEKILDLACGEGFFSREFNMYGGEVVGVDIAHELIKIAKENSPQSIQFYVGSADNLAFLENSSFDKVVIILALQNIENMAGVFKECSRVLKSKGKMFLVLNHPAFRIPKKSSWGYDEKIKIQYRRIDGYLSEIREEINMEPSKKTAKKTVSFHRPLQVYFKSLVKSGFFIGRLEEWVSNKKSRPGPRALLENRSRKEIPLFIMIEAIR